MVLDASRVDPVLRIGRGLSGVRFVLERIGSDDGDEWKRAVGSRLKVGKGAALSAVALAAGLLARSGRIGKGPAGAIGGVLALLVARSTGGIEEEGGDGSGGALAKIKRDRQGAGGELKGAGGE